MGTVFYIAPESLTDKETDYGVDLWALGIMMYKMLTGNYAFNESNNYLIFEAIKKG